MSQAPSLTSIQKTVWDGKLPLEIVLAPSESRSYDQTDPYLVRAHVLMVGCILTGLCRLHAHDSPISPRYCPG